MLHDESVPDHQSSDDHSQSGSAKGERSAVAYGLVNAEIEAIDSGLRSLFSVHSSLGYSAIAKFGSDEQKSELLPKMKTGELLAAFALTEPDSGSDPASLTTTATPDGSDWILHGRKRWNTNCMIGDLVITWARTPTGIRGFVVPTNSKGLVREAVTGKYSLRAAAATQFSMEQVRLPKSALLPGTIGLRSALECLNEARYGILWGVTGAMRSCLEQSLRYTTTRSQFGKPIAGFQLSQAKLVDMTTRLAHAQLLALRLGRLKEQGKLEPEQISMGKLANVNSALAVAQQARALLGANGVTREFSVMRHLANLESVVTYEGTAEIHTLIIGHAITGLQAFR